MTAGRHQAAPHAPAVGRDEEPTIRRHWRPWPQYPAPLPPQLTSYDLQRDCPFYSGQLPAEIRKLIFAFAVTEVATEYLTPLHAGQEASPQASHKYRWDRHSTYSRPGYDSWRRIPTALLRTCRRIYLETSHLPFANKQHVFWHGDAPWMLFPKPYNALLYELPYFSRFRPDQRAWVTDVHLHIRQASLEAQFHHMSVRWKLHCIQQLTLTLRRMDWAGWQKNETLRLAPGKTFAAPGAYDDDDDSDDACYDTWPEECWGRAFSRFALLRQLKMEFETSLDQHDDLDRLVAAAQRWIFPLQPGHELHAVGAVTTLTWRGPYDAWSGLCAQCRSPNGSEAFDINCQHCRDRRFLMDRGDGPLLVVKTVTWRAQAADEPGGG